MIGVNFFIILFIQKQKNDNWLKSFMKVMDGRVYYGSYVK